LRVRLADERGRDADVIGRRVRKVAHVLLELLESLGEHRLARLGVPEDAHARSIVLHQALHQLLLEEFTHGSDALPRGGCRRPLERIVFELELFNLMQIADGGLERDEKVLGSVQLLEHAQLGERDGQVLELIGAHLELLKQFEIANGRVELAQRVAY
jgi:hypothetical protein